LSFLLEPDSAANRGPLLILWTVKGPSEGVFPATLFVNILAAPMPKSQFLLSSPPKKGEAMAG